VRPSRGPELGILWGVRSERDRTGPASSRFLASVPSGRMGGEASAETVRARGDRRRSWSRHGAPGRDPDLRGSIAELALPWERRGKRDTASYAP
jgi:hypothetical protein